MWLGWSLGAGGWGLSAELKFRSTSFSLRFLCHDIVFKNCDIVSICRRSLEAKAALYERLQRGEGLKDLDRADEEGGATGDGPTYMVDFTKKVYEVRSPF